jgi:hypothetical protein
MATTETEKIDGGSVRRIYLVARIPFHERVMLTFESVLEITAESFRAATYHRASVAPPLYRSVVSALTELQQRSGAQRRQIRLLIPQDLAEYAADEAYDRLGLPIPRPSLQAQVLATKLAQYFDLSVEVVADSTTQAAFDTLLRTVHAPPTSDPLDAD